MILRFCSSPSAIPLPLPDSQLHLSSFSSQGLLQAPALLLLLPVPALRLRASCTAFLPATPPCPFLIAVNFPPARVKLVEGNYSHSYTPIMLLTVLSNAAAPVMAAAPLPCCCRVQSGPRGPGRTAAPLREGPRGSAGGRALDGGHRGARPSTVTPMAKAGGQPWLSEAPVGSGSAGRRVPLAPEAGGLQAAEPGEPPAELLSWQPPMCLEVPLSLPALRPSETSRQRLRGEVGTCRGFRRAAVPRGSTGPEGDWELPACSLPLGSVVNVAFRGGFPVGK